MLDYSTPQPGRISLMIAAPQLYHKNQSMRDLKWPGPAVCRPRTPSVSSSGGRAHLQQKYLARHCVCASTRGGGTVVVEATSSSRGNLSAAMQQKPCRACGMGPVSGETLLGVRFTGLRIGLAPTLWANRYRHFL